MKQMINYITKSCSYSFDVWWGFK